MKHRGAVVLWTISRLGLLAIPQGAAAGEIAGRVQLVGADRGAIPAAGAVVWVPGVPGALAPPAGATVASKDKRFDPHLLVVRRGTTVVFPNMDLIFHNVFSRSPGNEFDLGLYRGGKSRAFRFDTPGLVRIYCNIHAQMAAYVLVLDGASFAITGPDGAYRIPGLPEGRWELRAWHERAGEAHSGVDISGDRTASLDFVLDASALRDVPHKNKYGEDYPPATGDADRY